MCLGEGAHVVGHAGRDDLLGGEVDEHVRDGGHPLPLGRLGEGSSEHPRAQAAHERGQVHQAQEVGRIEEPPLGVLPAQERLRSRKGTVGERDDGLPMQDELVGVERAMDSSFSMWRRRMS